MRMKTTCQLVNLGSWCVVCGWPLQAHVRAHICFVYLFTWQWRRWWRWQRCRYYFSNGSNPKFWEIPLRTFVCIWLVRGTHFVASGCQSTAYASWVRQLDRCVAFDWFSIDSRKMCAHAVASSVNLFQHFLRCGNFYANIPNHPNSYWDALQVCHVLDVPISISTSIHRFLCAAIGRSIRTPICKMEQKEISSFSFWFRFAVRWANKPSTLSPCTVHFVALSVAVHSMC